MGDRLIILGRYLDRPVRAGEIRDVRGADGGPPYLVRWDDTGRDSLIYPGSDARIERPAVTVDASLVGPMGRPARDGSGGSSLSTEEAVTLVRHHLDLEKVHSGDHDRELWDLWQEEVARSVRTARVADVLDRVLARVRSGD